MKRGFFAHLALMGLTALMVTGCAQPPEPTKETSVESNVNTLVITSQGSLLWNDKAVSLEELAQRLEATKRMPTEPELRFEPSMSAPYDVSAAALQVIKESGVTKFGFVGNEKYRVQSETRN